MFTSRLPHRFIRLTHAHLLLFAVAWFATVGCSAGESSADEAFDITLPDVRTRDVVADAQPDAQEDIVADMDEDVDEDPQPDVPNDSSEDSAQDTTTDTTDDTQEDAETDSSLDADADAETDADSGVDVETDVGADADTDTSPDADAETDTSPDADAETDTSPDADAETDTSPDVTPSPTGLCANVARSPLLPSGPGTAPSAPLPFPVGQASNVALGALENPSVVTNPVAFGAVSTVEDLTSVPFDVYVPPSYDGSEPYGLIAFINSGDNGGGPNNSYRELLERERLIQVAPDGAGNSVNVDIRMGRALLGTLRAMELYNIDDTRIYTMGNSGGARSAHMLMHQYPQLYTGTLPRCGANYPREVDQDYETREPDSHYEFWGTFFFPSLGGQPYITALRGFERRFALMTSFDDFREGDVMNIYHNGMEEDGMFARLIQTTGPHCATNEAHFYDALGFVQHPLFSVVDDTFTDGDLAQSTGTGSGVFAVAGDIQETGNALLLNATAEPAAALVRDRLAWLDWHGLVLRAGITIDDDGASSALSLRPYDATLHSIDPASAAVGADGAAEIRLTVVRDGSSGSVTVQVQPESGAAIEVFAANFDDWPASSEPLDLRLDVWDAELQIDMGWHLQSPTSVTGGARLLDDRRTIRIRWSELLASTPWTAAAWENGAVLTVEARDGRARLEGLQARDGVGYRCE